MELRGTRMKIRVVHVEDEVLNFLIKFQIPQLFRSLNKGTYKVGVNCRACKIISYNNEKDFWGHQPIFKFLI